jgi:hypothetical protein
MSAVAGFAQTFEELFLIVTPIVGMLSVIMIFRARAMRTLAARWGLEYIGPPAPKWFGFAKVKPRLPISRNWYPDNEIRQVTNVIEGECSGVQVIIFDTLLNIGRGAYGTFIACRTESSPFEKDARGERVLKSPDWRILYNATALYSMDDERIAYRTAS